MIKKIGVFTNSLNRLFLIFPESIIALISRLAVASVFWRSTQTKISGGELFGQNWKFWSVNESTVFLFQYEYSLPLLPYKMAAYLATFSEYFLSLAVVLGFATRLSALGLLIMTAVIQVFVYPESWSVHILWAAILVYLIKHGGGKISLDHLLNKNIPA